MDNYKFAAEYAPLSVDPNKPTLTLIRGESGSGKSTFAKYLVSNQSGKAVHLEADMFFQRIDGSFRFNKERLRVAQHWCQDSARIFLHSGSNVVVSNTFTQLWELAPYLKLVQELGIDFYVLRMTSKFKPEPAKLIPQGVLRHQATKYEVFKFSDISSIIENGTMLRKAEV